MNPAPFQRPPQARLSRSRAKPVLRKLARHVLAILGAVAALTAFATAPLLEDWINHLVLAALR